MMPKYLKQWISESRIKIDTPHTKDADLRALLELYYELGKNHVEHKELAKKEAKKILGRPPNNVIIKYEADPRLNVHLEIAKAIEKIMKDKGYECEAPFGHNFWDEKYYLKFKKNVSRRT